MLTGSFSLFVYGFLAVATLLIAFACVIIDELNNAPTIEENQPFLKSDFKHGRKSIHRP
jgi:hypothetical protein